MRPFYCVKMEEFTIFEILCASKNLSAYEIKGNFKCNDNSWNMPWYFNISFQTFISDSKVEKI